MTEIARETQDSEAAKALALEMKEAFRTLSPFIEKHTALVCPACTSICCEDKHGRHDEHDCRFLIALGAVVPPEDAGRDASGPCRYMTAGGCSEERWKRPFRCTHFFCNNLLKSLENDDAKLYRTFNDYYYHLRCLREQFLELTEPG
jgi:hypothetical protein